VIEQEGTGHSSNKWIKRTLVLWKQVMSVPGVVGLKPWHDLVFIGGKVRQTTIKYYS
jgi:hypothetical protein